MGAIEYKGKFFADNAGQKYISEVEKEFSRQLQDEIARIQIRTKGGRDEGENNFKPYTAQYAKWKKGKGRNASVDLTFTGKMLTSIRSKVVKQGNKWLGIIGFASQLEANKALGNIDNGRSFFGFTKDFIKRLETAVQKIIPK